jgi:hypothetical protein
MIGVRDAARVTYRLLDFALPTGPLSNRFFLLVRFLRAHKRFPRNPCNPLATFNDLVFQRMVQDSWSLLERFCVDKEYAKIYVSSVCPDVRIAQTIALFDFVRPHSARDICDSLRQLAGKAAVAKPTHGSGMVLFLRREPAEDETWRFCVGASRSYYIYSRESQYKLLTPKVIVETDLSDGCNPLPDYKFFCSRGEVIFCQIDLDRFGDHRRQLVSIDFEPINVRYNYDRPDEPISKPENFQQMAEVASRLSLPFSFVRVDLYSADAGVVFGELTFAPEGAAGTLSNECFGVYVMDRIRSAQKAARHAARWIDWSAIAEEAQCNPPRP